jgi:homoserine O-succinyltransferase/O-acetyltransferase
VRTPLAAARKEEFPMPVFLNAKYPGPERRSGLNWPRVQPESHENSQRTFLHIGLVNNMGDAAMGSTELQFLSLLDAAAGDMLVHLTLYALPEVARKPAGQRRVGSFYSGIQQLWEQPPEQYPDGLIVTGSEPLTPDLRDEAYWPSFKRVLAWAQEHARSAVWSCLAAHAAVLALDGIGRVRGQRKHFGIFTCEQAVPHALLAGAPSSLRIPHSRWNGLSACQLDAKGYKVLTRTSDGGVDTFVKQDAGLFVFFQGHPEYGSETLLGEYRRDVGRYLKGEMKTYPLLPLDYFEEETERSLREIEAKARTLREERLLSDVSGILNSVRIHNTWRSTAVLTYRNWLEHLCMQKRRGGEPMLGMGIEEMPVLGHGPPFNSRDYRAFLPNAAQIPAH